MLIKNLDFKATKQARQTMCAQGTLTAAAASTVAVHEPGLDWGASVDRAFLFHFQGLHPPCK